MDDNPQPPLAKPKARSSFSIKKFLKEYGAPITLFLVKILTTWRTAADTYAVSRDWLDVALVDGVFLGMWLLMAYGGESQYARRVRPFAMVGTWTLYIMMLGIGWSAHHDFVSIAARIAGGIGLSLDTWDYLSAGGSALWKQWRAYSTTPPDVSTHGRRIMQKRLRESINRNADGLQAHLDVLVHERMKAALPELVYGHMEDVMVEPQATTAITIAQPRRPVIDRWYVIAPTLAAGQQFSRMEFQSIVGCKRSLAGELIAYAISIQAVREIRRGVYVYKGDATNGQ
jgi:hypothetical protein